MVCTSCGLLVCSPGSWPHCSCCSSQSRCCCSETESLSAGARVIQLWYEFLTILPVLWTVIGMSWRWSWNMMNSWGQLFWTWSSQSLVFCRYSLWGWKMKNMLWMVWYSLSQPLTLSVCFSSLKCKTDNPWSSSEQFLWLWSLLWYHSDNISSLAPPEEADEGMMSQDWRQEPCLWSPDMMARLTELCRKEEWEDLPWWLGLDWRWVYNHETNQKHNIT